MWFRVLSQAAVREGVELDSSARGYIHEGEVVRATDVQRTRTGQQRVKVDRGWISVYTRDGVQLLDRVIPFAGSSASTSDTAALDDQQPRHALSGVHCGLLAQGESVFPSRGDSMAQGESAFPSRSDSTVDSESSSSDDELLENPPTQQPQPQPRWQQPWQWGHSGAQGDSWRHAPRQDVSERGRMWVNGGVGPLVGTSGATSSATPRGGADRQHSPRSLLRSRHQDVQSEIRTLREMLGPPEQLVDDEDDDSNPYAVRASPPPMGHYESGVEPQQRPQTARSQGRNGQSGAARFRSSAPAPEPEPEPEGDSQGSELTRMSDEMLARLHRELSRKLDGVADEISRRQQAAIEHQLRQQVEQHVREEQLCKICVLRPRDTVFIPCGHMFSCNGCSMRVEFCPVCRSGISSRQRAFVS